MYQVLVFTFLGIWKSHSSLCNIFKAVVMFATAALLILLEIEPKKIFKFLLRITLGMFVIDRGINQKLRIIKIAKKVRIPTKNLLTSFICLNFNPKIFDLFRRKIFHFLIFFRNLTFHEFKPLYKFMICLIDCFACIHIKVST